MSGAATSHLAILTFSQIYESGKYKKKKAQIMFPASLTSPIIRFVLAARANNGEENVSSLPGSIKDG